MNRMQLSSLIKSSEIGDINDSIVGHCGGKRVLDIGCIEHTYERSKNNKNWLHGNICTVSKSCVGIDYLQETCKRLNDDGYNVVYGDVTSEIETIDKMNKFDVIVCGAIIEHLDNFKGLFDNIKKWLANDGIIIITTANPFYNQLFHYTALKNNIMVNEEHTCWIDPCNMYYLCERNGLTVEKYLLSSNNWRLSNLICDNKNFYYDAIQDSFINDNIIFKIIRKLVKLMFTPIYFLYRYISLSCSKLTVFSNYLVIAKRS